MDDAPKTLASPVDQASDRASDRATGRALGHVPSPVPEAAHPSCPEARELARMRSLHRTRLLDTPPEESFDRITRLARTALRVPVALMTLVDADRQWFKSRQGIDLTETPRDIAFCRYALDQAEPLLVTDARLDPRFADNPLVTGDPNIRFYLGVPLRMRDGTTIGALCAMDRRPRQALPGDVEMLRDLARMMINEIELRLLATTDGLTGVLSRVTLAAEGEQALLRARTAGAELACIMIDIDHFKRVNDCHGHATGDLVLQRVAEDCVPILRADDRFGRMGGEEFCAVLPNTGLAAAGLVAEKLRRAVTAGITPYAGDSITVTASFGVAALTQSDEDFAALLQRADAALFRAKTAGRDRITVSD